MVWASAAAQFWSRDRLWLRNCWIYLELESGPEFIFKPGKFESDSRSDSLTPYRRTGCVSPLPGAGSSCRDAWRPQCGASVTWDAVPKQSWLLKLRRAPAVKVPCSDPSLIPHWQWLRDSAGRRRRWDASWRELSGRLAAGLVTRRVTPSDRNRTSFQLNLGCITRE